MYFRAGMLLLRLSNVTAIILLITLLIGVYATDAMTAKLIDGFV